MSDIRSEDPHTPEPDPIQPQPDTDPGPAVEPDDDANLTEGPGVLEDPAWPKPSPDPEVEPSEPWAQEDDDS